LEKEFLVQGFVAAFRLLAHSEYHFSLKNYINMQE